MNKLTNHQLYRLIAAHFAEIVREPAVIFWGVVFPILMAWGLGIAFTQKGGEQISVALVKESSGSLTQPIAQLIEQSHRSANHPDSAYTIELKNEKLGNVQLTCYEAQWEGAYRLLKQGKVAVILQSTATGLTYNFDPANAEARAAYQLVKQVVEHGVSSYGINQGEIKPLTLLGTRYIDFLLPGLLAMGIMMACSWGISYSIIDRRSKKLLRRMVATPMRKSYFLFALITARFAMNVAEALLLFLFGRLYFGVMMQGGWLALSLLFLAGNLAFSGIAILISSRTANAEIGNGLINAVVTPMMVVSGVFFSYHHFPEWAIPVIRNLPLTMIADGFRSIFNEGVGVAEVWSKIGWLTLMGFVSFIIGLKVFKWH